MDILDIENWVTPASSYLEEQSGNFRLRKNSYVTGLRGLQGIDDFVFYDTKRAIPITALEELRDGEWKEWMVDDPFNYMAMQKYAQASAGNVLCAGLGLGLIAHELVKNDKVKSITIVEKSEDVCYLTSKYLPDGVELIHQDFLGFINGNDSKFDTVIVDIWAAKDIKAQQGDFLTNVMPTMFLVRNKYPDAVVAFHGYSLISDIKIGEVVRRGKWTPLSHQMLRGKARKYIIDKVKKPLMKAIIILSKRYPEPTRENCLNPNSHLLLDIQDEFLEYEANSGRRELFKALFRIVIGEYEHDPYYRSRMNWIIEEIVERVIDGLWLPRGENSPPTHWAEEKPYGLYQGRRFKKLIKGRFNNTGERRGGMPENKQGNER